MTFVGFVVGLLLIVYVVTVKHTGEFQIYRAYRPTTTFIRLYI